ncbi:MAG TPA: FecR family protein [Candidatus Methylomirabilis sp.]|nr:FecR family protein [Candidatus Methylomirabilis sp.]
MKILIRNVFHRERATVAIICTCALFVGLFVVGRAENALAQVCAWKHADGTRCDESIERCAEGCPLLDHDDTGDDQIVVPDDVVDDGGDQPVEPSPVQVDEKTYWMILTEDHGTNNVAPDADDEGDIQLVPDQDDEKKIEKMIRPVFKPFKYFSGEIRDREMKFEDLKPGEIVTAGPFERVKIVFKGSSDVIELAPGSSFQVAERDQFRLLNGDFYFFLKQVKDGRRYKIHGRPVSVSIRGTEFIMNETRDSTLLQVLEGSVEASDPQGKTTVLVQAGYQLISTEEGLGQPEPIEPDPIDIGFVKAATPTHDVLATSTIPGISDARLALLAGLAGTLILVWFVRAPRRK